MQKYAWLGAWVCAMMVGCGDEASVRIMSFDEVAGKRSSLQEVAILALVNDPNVDLSALDVEVGLDRRAARGIVLFRDGLDARVGTADDRTFDTLKRLERVRYLGPVGLGRLETYALAHDYEAAPLDPVDRKLVYMLNVTSTTLEVLDHEVPLDRRAAVSIHEYRMGEDAVFGTADDQRFHLLEEVDNLRFVGPVTLNKLRIYARDWHEPILAE